MRPIGRKRDYDTRQAGSGYGVSARMMTVNWVKVVGSTSVFLFFFPPPSKKPFRPVNFFRGRRDLLLRDGALVSLT